MENRRGLGQLVVHPSVTIRQRIAPLGRWVERSTPSSGGARNCGQDRRVRNGYRARRRRTGASDPMAAIQRGRFQRLRPPTYGSRGRPTAPAARRTIADTPPRSAMASSHPQILRGGGTQALRPAWGGCAIWPPAAAADAATGPVRRRALSVGNKGRGRRPSGDTGKTDRGGPPQDPSLEGSFSAIHLRRCAGTDSSSVAGTRSSA
jgi:hypothetical protein